MKTVICVIPDKSTEIVKKMQVNTINQVISGDLKKLSAVIEALNGAS